MRKSILVEPVAPATAQDDQGAADKPEQAASSTTATDAPCVSSA
jgi:hypothetical protein